MVFVDEIAKEKLIDDLDLFRSAEGIRQLQYFGVRLVDEDYNPQEIARYAVKKGYASRLGYLAECSLEAAEGLKVGNTEKLEKLIGCLYPHREKKYRFLCPRSNKDFGRTIRDIEISKSNSHLNKKWKVYAYGTVYDIAGYIDFYLIDLRNKNHGKIETGAEKILRLRKLFGEN